MKKLLSLLIVAFLALASQAFIFTPPPPFVPTVASGGCSQATAFLARTSITGTLATNYTTMICGMVTDGTWATLDSLYMLATDNTTDANLNLVSTSYPLTTHGAPTFTAYNGYTGNSSAYLSTTTNLSSYVNYSLNSGTLGVCDLTNRLSNAAYVAIGALSTTGSYIGPFSTTSGSASAINSAGGSTLPVTTALGSYIASRTNSSNHILYINAAAKATFAAASSAIPVFPIFILSVNNGGTAAENTLDQIAYAFVGSGMTSTQVTAMYTRLHTFLTAVGASSGC